MTSPFDPPPQLTTEANYTQTPLPPFRNTLEQHPSADQGKDVPLEDLYRGNKTVTGINQHPHHGTPADLRQASYWLFRGLSGAVKTPRPMTFLHPQTAADLAQALPAYHQTLNGCGIFPVSSGVSVFRSATGAVVNGVRTCHSRWCPVCAAKIEAKEAWETRGSLLHLHHTGQLTGRSMWHFIPTMRHSKEDDQRQNWRVFLEALEAFITSRFFRKHVKGYLLKIEIEGDLCRAGLHPHAHIVLILDDHTQTNAHTFAKMARAAFLEALERFGGSAAWGPMDSWFKPVTDARNLPEYLSKKGFPRWDVADEVCSSQAKNGGFWRRRVEDLALCHAFTEGVRLLRSGGIFRKARAAVREQHEARDPEPLTPIIRIPAAAWAARPDLREPIRTLAEDISLSPEWVAVLIAELFDLEPLKETLAA